MTLRLDDLSEVSTRWINGHLMIIAPDGRRIPVIMGGATDDGEDEKDDQEDEEEDDESSDDDEEDDDQEDDDKKKVKDPAAKLKSVEAAAARLAKKIKKKDAVITGLNERLAALESKDTSDDDKLKKEHGEVLKERDGLQGRVTELETRLMIAEHPRLAKLSSSRRKIIRKAIEDDLDVDDDGDSNMDDLLDALREEDPDLFKLNGKKKDDDEEDEEDDDDDASSSGKKKPKKPSSSSGTSPLGRDKKGKGGIDRAALEKRLPALRRR